MGKNLGSEKILDWKKSWIRKNLGSEKILDWKKILDEKKSWMGKKFWIGKNLGSDEILDWSKLELFTLRHALSQYDCSTRVSPKSFLFHRAHMRVSSCALSSCVSAWQVLEAVSSRISCIFRSYFAALCDRKCAFLVFPRIQTTCHRVHTSGACLFHESFSCVHSYAVASLT